MRKTKGDDRRILLTGGHAGTTALAVVEELYTRSGRWNIYWVGPKRALPTGGVKSYESTVLPRYGVTFYAITAGKLQRKFTLHTIPFILKTPFGFFHALFLIQKINPRLVVSFGGYAAFPMVVVAWLRRIPVIIHEQVAGLGLANRLSAPFAEKVALARREGLKLVNSRKAVVTGNPIMRSVLAVGSKNKIGNPPVLYLTGGSRGSQIINRSMIPILEKLLEDFRVIHQTGNLDCNKFEKIKNKLPKKLGDKYQIYAFIDPEDVADVYRQADIVIGRSGANTVAEIMAVKRPAILIPHPKLNFDEQTKNAVFTAKYGIAKVIPQSELTPDSLYQAVIDVSKRFSEITAAVKGKISPDLNGAKNLVDLIESVTHEA